MQTKAKVQKGTISPIYNNTDIEQDGLHTDDKRDDLFQLEAPKPRLMQLALISVSSSSVGP